MLKYKHIEAARELRLWITGILVPITIGGAGLLQIPEVRDRVGQWFRKDDKPKNGVR